MPTLPASSRPATPRLTVIVVNIPHLNGIASLLLADVFAGVEQFFGEDAVVAFDLPVVFRCVRPDAVVPGLAERRREIRCPIAGSVVGDHALDTSDAVYSEEEACVVHEIDGRCCGFVVAGFGVRQTSVAVDRGMQVGVAEASLRVLRFPALGSFGLLGAAAVGTPSAAVGDLPDLS